MEGSPRLNIGAWAMHIIGLVSGRDCRGSASGIGVSGGQEVVDDVGGIVRPRPGPLRMNAFKKEARGLGARGDRRSGARRPVFLFALANEEPGSLHQSQPEIREQAARIVPSRRARRRLSYAQWAARTSPTPRDVVRPLQAAWREKLTREERAELIAMAEAVAGPARPTTTPKLSIVTLRTALGPGQDGDRAGHRNILAPRAVLAGGGPRHARHPADQKLQNPRRAARLATGAPREP